MLPVFLCPTDAGTKEVRNGNPYYISAAALAAGKFGAKTSYDFSVLRYSQAADLWTTTNIATRRMFGAFASARFDDVKDGNSQVAFLIESTLDVKNGVQNTWGYSKWVCNGIDLATGQNCPPNTVGFQPGPASTANNFQVYGPENINFWWCCPWNPQNTHTRIPGQTYNWGAPGSQLVEHMVAKGGVWFATLGEIAVHVRKLVAGGRWSPRIERIPYYAKPVLRSPRPARQGGVRAPRRRGSSSG